MKQAHTHKHTKRVVPFHLLPAAIFQTVRHVYGHDSLRSALVDNNLRDVLTISIDLLRLGLEIFERVYSSAKGFISRYLLYIYFYERSILHSNELKWIERRDRNLEKWRWDLCQLTGLQSAYCGNTESVPPPSPIIINMYVLYMYTGGEIELAQRYAEDNPLCKVYVGTKEHTHIFTNFVCNILKQKKKLQHHETNKNKTHAMHFCIECTLFTTINPPLLACSPVLVYLRK